MAFSLLSASTTLPFTILLPLTLVQLYSASFSFSRMPICFCLRFSKHADCLIPWINSLYFYIGHSVSWPHSKVSFSKLSIKTFPSHSIYSLIFDPYFYLHGWSLHEISGMYMFTCLIFLYFFIVHCCFTNIYNIVWDILATH